MEKVQSNFKHSASIRCRDPFGDGALKVSQGNISRLEASSREKRSTADFFNREDQYCNVGMFASVFTTIPTSYNLHKNHEKFR